MIGLGSNRLSVCRRGGMSVTQAGRGGMEWLAGGRVPDWITPYSAQATAALLAQFPTQWPTIRDYGFAHPEIVGYMNAYAPEDAKIAYSLIPGLGTRKIISNNNAWCDFSDIVISAPVTCDIKFLMKSVSGDKVMVSVGNFRWMTIDGSRWCVANSSYITISSPSPQANVEYTNKIEVSTTQSKTYINGTLVYTGGVPPTRTGIKLFRNDSTTTGNWAADGSYFYYIHAYNDNGDVVRFVPYIKNGQNGILEMVSGVWKGNENTSASSSFTISETPAS